MKVKDLNPLRICFTRIRGGRIVVAEEPGAVVRSSVLFPAYASSCTGAGEEGLELEPELASVWWGRATLVHTLLLSVWQSFQLFSWLRAVLIFQSRNYVLILLGGDFSRYRLLTSLIFL